MHGRAAWQKKDPEVPAQCRLHLVQNYSSIFGEATCQNYCSVVVRQMGQQVLDTLMLQMGNYDYGRRKYKISSTAGT